MERKKRSKGSVWEFCYANKIFGTFEDEIRASGQKLVKFCAHTHTHAAKLVVRMDDLSDQLNNSNIGGNFGSGQLVNHISYADDVCLLSFSTAGMQKLLNICDKYSNDHDLIYNSKKTMCMCFTPKSCKSYECKLSLNQGSLSYVRAAGYLGVVIQSSGTDKDVNRQMRKYYAGINTIIRRFYACSYDVNVTYLGSIYRACTVGNSGSIAPNII